MCSKAVVVVASSRARVVFTAGARDDTVNARSRPTDLFIAQWNESRKSRWVRKKKPQPINRARTQPKKKLFLNPRNRGGDDEFGHSFVALLMVPVSITQVCAATGEAHREYTEELYILALYICCIVCYFVDEYNSLPERSEWTEKTFIYWFFNNYFNRFFFHTNLVV